MVSSMVGLAGDVRVSVCLCVAFHNSAISELIFKIQSASERARKIKNLRLSLVFEIFFKIFLKKILKLRKKFFF